MMLVMTGCFPGSVACVLVSLPPLAAPAEPVAAAH
jgi:hypothetical protein